MNAQASWCRVLNRGKQWFVVTGSISYTSRRFAFVWEKIAATAPIQEISERKLGAKIGLQETFFFPLYSVQHMFCIKKLNRFVFCLPSWVFVMVFRTLVLEISFRQDLANSDKNSTDVGLEFVCAFNLSNKCYL